MKIILTAALTLAPLSAALTVQPAEAQIYCPPCPVQSKVPSSQYKGSFDYKMKCTDPVTKNSAVINVTAKTDDAALHSAWNSPRLDEIIVGMEAAAYACAEPPKK